MKEKAFKLFTGFFLITALYHVAGLVYPVNDSPKWRHLLFIVINLLCAYGMFKRPTWFIYFFFILLIQQLNSHGSSLVDTWIEVRRISWIDLSVVTITPIMFLLLLSERINSKQ